MVCTRLVYIRISTSSRLMRQSPENKFIVSENHYTQFILTRITSLPQIYCTNSFWIVTFQPITMYRVSKFGCLGKRALYSRFFELDKLKTENKSRWHLLFSSCSEKFDFYFLIAYLWKYKHFLGRMHWCRQFLISYWK